MRRRGFGIVEIGFLIITFLMGNTSVHAQHEYDAKSTLRIQVDNDFLNYRGKGTDRYYTSGVQIEYSRPIKKQKFLTSGLLLSLGKDSEMISHWALTQLMFTPDDISASKVLYNNYPYAGALFVSKGLTSFDRAKKLSLHSELNIGVIGPYSFAKETQTWVHDIIHYIKPNGWNNQIKTDLVLNYNIEVKKEVFAASKLQGHIQLASKAGTLFNDLGVGFGFRAGKFYQNPSSLQNLRRPTNRSKKAISQFYFYSSGQVKFVLENSLLQGGLLQSIKNNRDGFYHVAAKDMKRTVATYEAGLMLDMSKWGLSVSQHFISSEFKAADTQLFGRVEVIYKFN